MKIPISPEIASKILKQSLPEYDEFIGQLLDEPEITQRILEFSKKAGLGWYPQLYLDKQNLVKLILLTLMPVEQIKSLNEHAKTLSPEQAIEFANLTVANMSDSPEMLDEILDSLIPDDLSNVEPTDLSTHAKIALATFLFSFHDILAFLAHGRRLTDLVQDALSGDDEAFCMAAQTDRLVLDIPYFQERILNAHKVKTKENELFLNNIEYRMQNPPLQGKIKQRKVWIALLLLDSMALLDGQLTRSEILRMLEDAGIENIGSEDNISRMLRSFRAYQNDS